MPALIAEPSAQNETGGIEDGDIGPHDCLACGGLDDLNPHILRGKVKVENGQFLGDASLDVQREAVRSAAFLRPLETASVAG